jgi:demethylmenaquinone methyltransferase/2-methoxy-6-polyprenyl-1,4-benzoquinol methylase
VISNLDRYERIAPYYDLIDLPFESRRYRALRPLLFRGLSGRLLEAGVGTGRNFPFYPMGVSSVVGIDLSPRMLARAERRRGLSPVPIELRLMDVTSLAFANDTFDAAVSTFLFCVLPDRQQAPALRELGRVVKPGGSIRFLEYLRPHGTLRRIVSKIWEPWVAFAYGASFDRHTESHLPAAGLEVDESRYVVDDLVKLICARARR